MVQKLSSLIQTRVDHRLTRLSRTWNPSSEQTIDKKSTSKVPGGRNNDSYADQNSPHRLMSLEIDQRVRELRFQWASYKYATIPPAEEKKYHPTTSPPSRSAPGQEKKRFVGRQSISVVVVTAKAASTRPRTVGQCQCRLTQNTIGADQEEGRKLEVGALYSTRQCQ